MGSGPEGSRSCVPAPEPMTSSLRTWSLSPPVTIAGRRGATRAAFAGRRGRRGRRRHARLLAVGRPVPGLARQVGQAVRAGVALQPAEAGGAPLDGAATAGEVDGEAPLVHRGPRPGGGR